MLENPPENKTLIRFARVQTVHNARKTQTDVSNWDCSSMLSLSEPTDGWLRNFSDTIKLLFTRKLKNSS